MTKKNNKKTPEPMFVGTEPEEVGSTLVNPEFTTKVLEGFSQVYPEDFPTTTGQMEEMRSVTWVHEESGPMPEVSLHQLEEGSKSITSFTFIDTSDAATRGPAYVNPLYAMYREPQYIEPKPETDDGTRPESPLRSDEIALKIIDAAGGKFPTQIMDSLIQPGQKEYKHPFDPINDLHYQLNNAIQPLVDSMQKIIRDPYKASEVMSTVHFNYMVKEYGYLHSFLELSHKLIKERLRERV